MAAENFSSSNGSHSSTDSDHVSPAVPGSGLHSQHQPTDTAQGHQTRGSHA